MGRKGATDGASNPTTFPTRESAGTQEAGCERSPAPLDPPKLEEMGRCMG
jgi:hypothetical protein